MADSDDQTRQSLWHKFSMTGREKDNDIEGSSDPTYNGQATGAARRVFRDVVPGLPRTQTMKRQQSEVRSRLEAVRLTPAERRAVSADRRMDSFASTLNYCDPRSSAPDFPHRPLRAAPSLASLPTDPVERMPGAASDRELDRLDMERERHSAADTASRVDMQSMTTSQYGALIDSELQRLWILNLSMHFRDKSRREKFFVTYRQSEHNWRRVTISIDYRNAPPDSLEDELSRMQLQRDKSAKIYEAIRESLPEIQFFDTVTNLRLETRDGRLYIHVVEDLNVCAIITL